MFHKTKIYLAGQIGGLDYADTIGWRKYVSINLGEDFLCLSPMRSKDFLEKTGVDVELLSFDDPVEKAVTSSKGIVARDRNDVYTCDAVFINLLNITKVSIGTMIEIGWANAYNKPIVLVMDKGNLHDHLMVTEIASFIVPDLNSGITIVKSLFPSATHYY